MGVWIWDDNSERINSIEIEKRFYPQKFACVNPEQQTFRATAKEQKIKGLKKKRFYKSYCLIHYSTVERFHFVPSRLPKLNQKMYTYDALDDREERYIFSRA